MSKVSGQLIASQMAAERVRTTELPEQLEALRSALVEGSDSNRVVVIIDELDRCHPEYAISFLEATKLIFGQSGFVFCLMMNVDYLENHARHRFGTVKKDERYLDKFVDIRLKLDPRPEVFKTAVFELACELPLAIPFGDNYAFSVERAAKLAGELAVEAGFSMRKTKRILLRVELALRCYADFPLDAPLLVLMAFHDEDPTIVMEEKLSRSFLTPEEGKRETDLSEGDLSRFEDGRKRDYRLNSTLQKTAPELMHLPPDRYANPEGIDFKPWTLVYTALAPHYIPSHRQVLDGVASVMVSDEQS